MAGSSLSPTHTHTRSLAEAHDEQTPTHLLLPEAHEGFLSPLPGNTGSCTKREPKLVHDEKQNNGIGFFLREREKDKKKNMKVCNPQRDELEFISASRSHYLLQNLLKSL